MKKTLLALALSAGLLVSGPGTGVATAGKGGGFSSGGKSFSSGGRGFSSGGRGFSSGGSSSSGRSFSSGGSSGKSWSSSSGSGSGGKGFSSGSSSGSGGKGFSSGSSSGSGHTPTAGSSGSGGKSYTSGSSPSPAATPSRNGTPSGPAAGGSKPSGVNFDRAAAAAQQKAESRSSYTRAQGSANGSPSVVRPMTTPSSTPRGRTYSLGGSPSTNGTSSGPRYASGGTTTGGAAGTRPAGPGYDRNAGQARRKEESRAVYTMGQQPRPAYTDAGGRTHPVDPRDRQVEDLRRQLDYERWANRAQRRQVFYHNYYTGLPPGPVVTVYHDPYSNFFWWWLWSQSLDNQARWAYHHRYTMDDARYRDLLARNQALETKVNELEAQKLPRDPTYRPPGLSDPDLMYNDDYVEAAYNPTPEPEPAPGPEPQTATGVVVQRPAVERHPFWVLLKVFFVLSMMCLMIWLVFFKRWGGTEPAEQAGGAA